LPQRGCLKTLYIVGSPTNSSSLVIGRVSARSALRPLWYRNYFPRFLPTTLILIWAAAGEAVFEGVFCTWHVARCALLTLDRGSLKSRGYMSWPRAFPEGKAARKGRRMQTFPGKGRCLAGHFGDVASHTTRGLVADAAGLFGVLPCRAAAHAAVQLGDFCSFHV